MEQRDKKLNIDSFLTNEVNISIYKNYDKFLHNFDILELFINLKKEFDFFISNSQKFSSIFVHFQSEILIEHKKSFEIYMSSADLFHSEIIKLHSELFFYESLYSQIDFQFREHELTEVQKQSLNFIKESKKEVERYLHLLFSRTYDEIDDIKNIEDLISYLDNLNDFDEKIETLLKLKYKLIESNELENEDNETFIYQCNLELEKFKELKGFYANENEPIVQVGKIEKHENIFSNNGFVLFEHILNEYVKPLGKRGRLSDIHFFYWSMFNNKPQLIHQRPERFKEWFSKNYDNEDLGKIKTYVQVQDSDRKKHYSNALDWFKTQS